MNVMWILYSEAGRDFSSKKFNKIGRKRRKEVEMTEFIKKEAS